MAKFYEEIEEHTKEDAEGNITVDTVRKTKSVKKSEEPEYIKIYTNMWGEFNQIPVKWRPLLLALACRMSFAKAAPNQYNDTNKTHGGQIVNTGGNFAKEIQKECGWKSLDTLYHGLQALQKYNAIRQIGRGVYQVNPQYAGRGGWYYNAHDEQGGISNLITTFNFRNKTVDTQIIWATDNQRMEEEKVMERMREQMEKAYATEIVATRTKISIQKEPGEFEDDDNDSNNDN